MKITGECHCGSIAYEAEVDPDRVGICHCADCQSLSASAFRTVALVAADAFKLTKGSPKEYVKQAESGNKRAQAFCPDCGSAIYATSAEKPRTSYNIRLGTCHQRENLTPVFECWTQSALPWQALQPDTKKFAQNPQ